MAEETSVWEKYGLEAKVTSILERVTSQGHHFGRPYLTASQLAIAFSERFPETTQAIGLPVAVNCIEFRQQGSLAECLAQELSRRIDAGRIRHIEGAFLCTLRIAELTYRYGENWIARPIGEPVGDDVLMFRYRDEGQGPS